MAVSPLAADEEMKVKNIGYNVIVHFSCEGKHIQAEALYGFVNDGDSIFTGRYPTMSGEEADNYYFPIAFKENRTGGYELLVNPFAMQRRGPLKAFFKEDKEELSKKLKEFAEKLRDIVSSKGKLNQKVVEGVYRRFFY